MYGNLKITLSLLLIPGIAALMLGCASEEVAVDMDPPNQVQIIPHSADTVLVEQGIDALPEGNYIYLSWEQNLATDLAGYRVYRRAHEDEPTDFMLIADLEKDETEYEDRDPVVAPDQVTGLTTGFSYRVSAYDESGNEGSLSEEVYYKLLLKPDLSDPWLDQAGLHLQWSYDTSAPDPVDYFVIRLFREIDNQWYPFWLTTYQLFSPLEVVYSDPIDDGTYRYQVDVIGATPPEQPAGSERVYQFTIP
jgi:hypothetical protein